jgi:ribonuclease III
MRAKQLRALEQGLNYEFKTRELIVEALTHRSHHHEFQDSPHNERLEFLGDAVLNLCVSEAIMRLFPSTSEGHLSKLRSQLVSRNALSALARKLDLGAAVRLGKGEDQSGGRERDALLADTFEAVIAAVYMDGGMDAARLVLTGLLNLGGKELEWSQTSKQLLTRDFKSRLQEFCQSRSFGTPTYECLETSGPDHQRRFIMALMIQGHELLRAPGSTKKEATLKAAEALLNMGQTDEELVQYLESKGVKARLKDKSI